MCMWHKSTSCAERDAPDTSGGTPQLRGERTGKDLTGTISAFAPHFTPLDNVNPGKSHQTNIPEQHCRRLY